MGFPLFNQLVIETIGSCNRTCPSCLRQSYPEARSSKSLPLLRTVETGVSQGVKLETEVFESLIDQSAALGFRGLVTLQFFNEPLLDDRLVDLGLYVRAKLPKSKRTFCSNGDLITPELAAEIDGVFHQINLSLYMPQAKQEARREWLRSLFKKTHLNFRHGIHFMTHFSPGPGLEEAVHAFQGQPCTLFDRWLIVNATGDVSYCCEDVNADFGLGNIKDTPVKEIWFGDRNRHLVRTLRHAGGRKKLPYCASCPRPERGRGRRPEFRVHDLEKKLRQEAS